MKRVPKTLSVLLSVTMLFTSFDVTAFAQENSMQLQNETVSEEQSDEQIITEEYVSEEQTEENAKQETTKEITSETTYEEYQNDIQSTDIVEETEVLSTEAESETYDFTSAKLSNAIGTYKSIFPDKEFRKLVLDNLYNKIESDEVYLEDLLQINNLYKNNNNSMDRCIRSLEGIQYLTELKDIQFDYNEISDIDTIDWSLFKNITNISLRGNNISKIPDFSKCTQLRYIDVSENLIPDEELDTLIKKLPSAYETYNGYVNYFKRSQRLNGVQIIKENNYYYIDGNLYFIAELTGYKKGLDYTAKWKIDDKEYNVDILDNNSSVFYFVSNDISLGTHTLQAELYSNSVLIEKSQKTTITVSELLGFNQQRYYITGVDKYFEVAFAAQEAIDNKSFEILNKKGQVVSVAENSYSYDFQYNNLGYYFTYSDMVFPTVMMNTFRLVGSSEYIMLADGLYDFRITYSDGTTKLYKDMLEVTNSSYISDVSSAYSYDNFGDYIYINVTGNNIDGSRLIYTIRDNYGNILPTSFKSYKKTDDGIIVKLKKNGWTNLNLEYQKVSIKISATDGYSIKGDGIEKNIYFSGHLYYAKYNQINKKFEFGIDSIYMGKKITANLRTSYDDEEDLATSSWTMDSYISEITMYDNNGKVFDVSNGFYYCTVYAEGELIGCNYIYVYFVDESDDTDEDDPNEDDIVVEPIFYLENSIIKGTERINFTIENFYQYNSQSAALKNYEIKIFKDNKELSLKPDIYVKCNDKNYVVLYGYFHVSDLDAGEYTIKISYMGNIIAIGDFSIYSVDKFIITDSYINSYWESEDELIIGFSTLKTQNDNYTVKLVDIYGNEVKGLKTETKYNFSSYYVELSVTGLKKSEARKSYYLSITHDTFGTAYDYEGNEVFEGMGMQISFDLRNYLSYSMQNNRVISVYFNKYTAPITLAVFRPYDTSAIYQKEIASYELTEGGEYYFTKDLVNSLPDQNGLYDIVVFDGHGHVGTLESKIIGYSKYYTGDYSEDDKNNTYKVVFNANGGSGTMSSTEYKTNTNYVLPANIFTRKCYVFTGWNTRKDGSGVAYDDKETVANMSMTSGDTVTLYAQWRIINYHVLFDANGGKGSMNKLDCDYLIAYTLPENAFVRKGYVFTGWNRRKDGKGTAYADKATVKNLTGTDGLTVTLYAQWEKKDSTQNDFEYDIISAKQIEITDYNGKSSKVKIPETIDGYTVVRIGSEAFYGYEQLTQVSLPNTVRSIGKNAFSFCDSLTSINLPGSLETIDDYAFYDCAGLTRLTIPKSVKSIKKGAFTGCEGLEYIDLSYYTGTIAYYTFYGCVSLTEVKLSDAVERIESEAFCGCQSLYKINIPKNLKYIGYEAFLSCISLKNFSYPSGLTYIGDMAFAECKGFKEIVVPASVEYVGALAFMDCINLERVTVPNLANVEDEGYTMNHLFGKEADRQMKKLKKVTLTNAEFIDRGAFKYWKYIEEVCLPDNLVEIGRDAFYECENLKIIKFPESTKSIGDNAFAGCVRLDNIVLPSELTTIGVCAFEDCKSLSQITIPDSIEEIGGDAFKSCEGLTEIEIPGSVKKIGNGALYRCYNLESISIPNIITMSDLIYYISDDYKKLKKVTINSGDYIKDYCFYDWEYIEEIVLPDTVTSIGFSAFHCCYKLSKLELPKNLKTIKKYAFFRCESFTDITLPDSVTNIDDYAFDSCKNLRKITIGKKVTSLGSLIFYCVPNVVIYGYRNSEIEKYAKSNYIKFVYIDNVSQYTIVFNANGGTGTMENLKCYTGSNYNLPANRFTKKCYVFTGWNTSPYGDGVSYKNEEAIKNITDKNTITLYAQWRLIKYNVVFNANGGTGTMDSMDCNYLTKYNLPACTFTKKCYVLAGWNRKKDGTGTSYAPGAEVKNMTSTDGATVTLYAQWRLIQYTVAFNANGGTGTMNPIDCDYLSKYTLPSNAFKREGYVFVGWNRKKDGTGTSYAPGAEVKNMTSTDGAKVTLYAQWKKK